jgi:hypothetical protein
MWSKKRQRYVFRKRSRRGLISGLLVGTLLVVGLAWFMPWQTLSLAGVQDMLRLEASKDQPEQAPAEDEQAPAEDEQAPAEDEPEQPNPQEQPEQAGTSDQPTNEATLEGAPPNGEGATNNLPSPSPPAAVQISPPPQSPSTPRAEEAPQNSIYPNDYWYSGADYWGSEAGYWDSDWDYYESYYYWD